MRWIGILTVQIFQNIGMIVGLMPVKGIALPFLSYGEVPYSQI